MPLRLRQIAQEENHNGWRKRLRVFFSHAAVELAIGALILLSVVLVVVEYGLEAGGDAAAHPLYPWVVWTNEAILWLFIVELGLRFAASNSKKRFFREYWIDIVAVTPWYYVFRAARLVRLVRLVRLLRLLRLFGVVSRLGIHFPAIVKRGFAEYLVVCGLLVVTIVFGATALNYFERPDERGAAGLEQSFWASIYTLFAGEPIPGPPKTIGGKVVTVAVMFMGLTIFAMFTGTVSAFMVERFRMENKSIDLEDVRNHIIICGWNTKAEIIIREYDASPATKHMHIVVITQFEHEHAPQLPANIQRKVLFLDDDFTRVAALERAHIKRAVTCIILSDTSGGRSEQDADARTILSALTVEKISPNVYTCAELINRSYASHLELGKVNDYVVSGEYSAYMLAQAAMNRGLMGVITELLTYEHGNEFYRIAINPHWHGVSYLDAMLELKRTYNATLVAVQPHDGKMLVNPTQHTLAEGDEIVVIAEGEFALKRGVGPADGK